jgi:hypothetical protein
MEIPIMKQNLLKGLCAVILITFVNIAYAQNTNKMNCGQIPNPPKL